VLVNFWATWCGPCRKEMPHLNRIADKYRASGLVLLGINVDDDARNAADLATKLGVKFPVLFDTDKKVSKLYDLNSMPSTLVIDRNGRVRYLHRGYQDGYETCTTADPRPVEGMTNMLHLLPARVRVVALAGCALFALGLRLDRAVGEAVRARAPGLADHAVLARWPGRQAPGTRARSA